jgi:hypothetical protein
MNISNLRVGFAGTLALVLLSILAPTKLSAENKHAEHSGGVKPSTGSMKKEVPEPSSFVLLGSGLVVAALVLRRKGIGLP